MEVRGELNGAARARPCSSHGSAFAHDHSALNGAWKLVGKSDFGGQPVVQTGTVTIQDRQGIAIISRSFV